MKKIYILIIAIFTISFVNAQSLQSKSDQAGWTTDNPFKTDVFVENHGQFDTWAKSSYPILYAVNNSDKIFFTKQGVIFKLEKIEHLSEEKREQPDKKKLSKETQIFFVAMNWEGSNPNSEIIVSEVSEGYYTFGEKGYENIKAKGFKKLLYKNLYPDIDVEYTIPKKGGIKYKIILHPGADASQIKMHYSGDVDIIKKDKKGNIIIETLAGDITDHAPESFYEADKKQINSAFQVKEKTVLFELTGINLSVKSKTIIIDPWTTTPTSLFSNNAALDIEFDDYGNVYVTGGSHPYKLVKYSNQGAFQWVFTNPLNWGLTNWKSYSKFCVIPKSGTSYIGEGFVSITSGCRIMKINTNGNLDYTSSYFGSNNEIWTILYNNCSKQLIAFGGGTTTSDNIKIIADTNLLSSISKVYNGITACVCNDVASAVMDNNGDFYALTTAFDSTTCPIEGHLQKSLFSTNYSPPCAFDVQTSYQFREGSNLLGISGSVTTVRANALALNNNYLFSYDGKTLKAWDKINGNLIGSVIVDNNYTGGVNRLHEGIDVDECNNVYVGGTNKVHVYSFTGFSFIALSPITINIINEVRDIKINRDNGILFICGNSFVTEVIAPISCSVSIILTAFSTTSDACFYGNACVTATGGVPPYSYQWSNGSIDSCIMGVPFGVYTVTISDNSCTLNSKTDTVLINFVYQIVIDSINPVICQGEIFHVSTHNYSLTGTYIDTLSVYLGCDSIVFTNLTVNPLPNINLGNDITICIGSPYILNAAYHNTTYLWQDNSTNSIFTVTQAGLYWVKATIDICSITDSINIVFIDCEPKLELPNIITPNKDGSNDIFVPLQSKNIEKMNTQIFNRWGGLVYETDKLNIEWDGKQNGKLVADGVYYWIVNYTDTNRKEGMMKGSVTVMN